MAHLTCGSDTKYSLLSYEDVIVPVLTAELIKGAKSLLDQGVSPENIMQAFETLCNMVIKKIKKLSISMEGKDMKGILSRFYATQHPEKLFGRYREHIADVIVGAVHATGYDYEYSGPFYASISDFEDGFDLIKVKKVSGGCMVDSSFVEGIAVKSNVDGFEKLDVVENPKILLFNIKPESQKKDAGLGVNIIDIMENHLKYSPDVILSCQAIDGNTKKELANRGIYFADLVAEGDVSRVVKAIYAKPISNNHNYQPRILIGTCERVEKKKFGDEVFGIFSGCCRGKAATIVLCGNDQFIEEAEMYIRDLIPEVRSVMKDYKLVAGGCALYNDIIQYIQNVLGEANIVDKDLNLIIEVFAKAIQAASKKTEKTRDDVGIDVVNNPCQNHAVAPGEGASLWEPPSVKINAILCAVHTVCYELKSLIIGEGASVWESHHP